MSGRQTAVGKILADIDAEAKAIGTALEMIESTTPEAMRSRLAELDRTRAIVAKHEKPAAPDAPKRTRKPRAKKNGGSSGD